MIFESFVTPLLFDDYREFQEKNTAFNKDGKVQKLF